MSLLHKAALAAGIVNVLQSIAAVIQIMVAVQTIRKEN